jgi:hypothetical protein
MSSVKLLVVTIVLAAFLMMVFPAMAAFTVPPTMDLTTSSNCSGATNAIYTFHAENPNAEETVVAFTVPVPAGYSVNPAYLTATPGTVVMTGTYGPVGTTVINGLLSLETTSTIGEFAIIATNTNPPIPPVQIGQANLVPPTSTAAAWTVAISPSVPNNGEYIELAFVAGFFINPETPGVYTWGPSTATPFTGSSVTMNPRPGFTNQVHITVCAVGGYVEPVNRLTVFAPYLALFGVIAAAAVVAAASRKKLED